MKECREFDPKIRDLCGKYPSCRMVLLVGKSSYGHMFTHVVLCCPDHKSDLEERGYREMSEEEQECAEVLEQ